LSRAGLERFELHSGGYLKGSQDDVEDASVILEDLNRRVGGGVRGTIQMFKTVDAAIDGVILDQVR
jgi:hypothetical protein